MFPFQLPGIIRTGKMLLPGPTGRTSRNKRTLGLRFPTAGKPRIFKRPAAANPMQTFARGLSSAFRSLSSTLMPQKSTREDYASVIKRFIPENAVLLKPAYPANAKEIQLADLDGDTQRELIGSFQYNGKLKTLLLKKQKEKWEQLGVIENTGYDSINYRGTADFHGTGKKQLLLGLEPRDAVPMLHVYSLEEGNLHPVFSRNYHRFEIIRPPDGERPGAKAQLAVWDRRNTGEYDIEVLRWNGTQFEPAGGDTRYYYNNVASHFVRKIRQTPNDLSSWYNLSSALTKAGASRDALAAIELGMSQDHSLAYKDRFLALRNEIVKK